MTDLLTRTSTELTTLDAAAAPMLYPPAEPIRLTPANYIRAAPGTAPGSIMLTEYDRAGRFLREFPLLP